MLTGAFELPIVASFASVRTNQPRPSGSTHHHQLGAETRCASFEKGSTIGLRFASKSGLLVFKRHPNNQTLKGVNICTIE